MFQSQSLKKTNNDTQGEELLGSRKHTNFTVGIPEIHLNRNNIFGQIPPPHANSMWHKTGKSDTVGKLDCKTKKLDIGIFSRGLRDVTQA
jgi:hypothetical protein